MARILIVEDDGNLADAVALLLRGSGHEARSVNDGATALAEAARLAPEIVIFDVGLPALDGITLADALRDRYGIELGLVALTAQDDSATLQRLASAGVDAVLIKPALLDEILDAIDRCTCRASNTARFGTMHSSGATPRTG